MNILKTLYDICVSLISNINIVWEFITTQQTISVPLLSDIVFTPIHYLGAGIGVLITIWVIKALLPMS